MHNKVDVSTYGNGTTVSNEKVKLLSIDSMSDIGKLTHLLWGYNVVDENGIMMRKFAFLSKYPDKVAVLLDELYTDRFHKYKLSADEEDYRTNVVRVRFKELTGMVLVRTRDLR